MSSGRAKGRSLGQDARNARCSPRNMSPNSSSPGGAAEMIFDIALRDERHPGRLPPLQGCSSGSRAYPGRRHAFRVPCPGLRPIAPYTGLRRIHEPQKNWFIGVLRDVNLVGPASDSGVFVSQKISMGGFQQIRCRTSRNQQRCFRKKRECIQATTQNGLDLKGKMAKP
jgi:hypothetical protein